MTTELKGHHVNEVNRQIAIAREGSRYAVLADGDDIPLKHMIVLLKFHEGPPADGVNGITLEVLIEVLIDRLQQHQSGEFSCRENAIAITKLEEAKLWLNHRTRTRDLRGVEGTQQP